MDFLYPKLSMKNKLSNPSPESKDRLIYKVQSRCVALKLVCVLYELCTSHPNNLTTNKAMKHDGVLEIECKHLQVKAGVSHSHSLHSKETRTILVTRLLLLDKSVRGKKGGVSHTSKRKKRGVS